MSEELGPDHEAWEVLFAARKVFGEQQKEKPWIRHQQLEPTIKLHLAEPRINGDEPILCVCGAEIPPLIMAKFWWAKAVYEGKQAGAKITPDGVTLDSNTFSPPKS